MDYPGLHIGNSHAWGSMQGGVNMLVFSGTAGAYNAKGNYYAVAEICSVPAVSEDRRRRDLEHCYYNKKDRHTYRITGQRGYATQLLRDDGQRFVYGMQTGALSQA